MRELNEGQTSKVEGRVKFQREPVSRSSPPSFAPAVHWRAGYEGVRASGARSEKREARSDGVRRTLTCAKLSTFRSPSIRPLSG